MLAVKSRFSKTMYGPNRPLAMVEARGSQVASAPGTPSLWCFCSGRTGLLMWLAGTAPGWKRTSEEFLFSFQECHKRASQWFCFCEMSSVVGVFFLEASGAAHLHSVSGKGRGSRLLPGSWTERTWAGWLFGWDQPPGPWKRSPCPPSTEAAPPHWPSLTGLAWTDPVAVASGTELHGPEAMLPECSAILRVCAA